MTPRRSYLVALASLMAGIIGTLIVVEWEADASTTVSTPRLEPHTSTPPTSQAPSHVGYWEKGVTNWITPTTRQKYTLTDFRQLVVTDERWDEEDSEWKHLNHMESASFDMLRVATAKVDRFCFAGIARNGDLVIERWALNPMTLPGPGGGTVEIINEDGLSPKTFRKVEVFRGPLGDGILALEFDLEERYIMALVQDGALHTLYSFANEEDAQPVWILDSATLPALGDMWYMNKLHHAYVGRVLLLSSDHVHSERVVLVDADNDGYFEGQTLVGNSAYFQSIGFDDYSLWDALIGP